MLKKLQILFVSLFIIGYSYSQCTVTITESEDTIVCGQQVALQAVGLAASPALSSNFDGNSIGPGWSSSGTVQYNNPCGPNLDGTPSAWFGNVPFPRTLTTNGFDLSCGAQICFDIDFAGDDACGGCSDCEDPDEIDEGVFFQYSIDGGATWVDLFYFEPTSNKSGPYYQWANYCFTIPPAAQTANTMFQWDQTDATTTVNDHWGIDNVIITPSNCGYDYDWDNIPGTVDPQNQVVVPSTDTSFIVVHTNGIESCTDTIDIVVQPLIANATTDVASVSCGCANLNVDLTNSSAGSIIDDFDPAINNTMWFEIENGTADIGCGSMSGNGLYFNGSGARHAITAPIDATNCGNIDYCLYIGNTGSAFPCGNASTGEDVRLQYSIDGGITWVNIITHNQSSWDLNNFFQCFSQPMPAAAQTASTQFRWVQPTFTGCNGCDNWSLDNVNIACIPPTIQYNWTPATGLSDPTIRNPQACITNTTTYTATITNTVTGCSASDDVTINATPCQCSINNFTAIIDPCQPGGTFNVGGTFSYVDNPPNGQLIVEVTNASGTYTQVFNPPFYPGLQYSYNITGVPADGSPMTTTAYFTNNIGCTVTLNDVSPAIPTVDGISGGATYCEGEFVNDILVDVIGASPFTIDYTLNGVPMSVTDAASPISLGNNAGSYILTAITDANCNNTTNLTDAIVINPLPAVDAGADFLVCENIAITLSGSGADTYVWDNGVTDGTSFVQNPGIVTYTVTGTDANNCVNTDDITVEVEANPVANFVADTLLGCVPFGVTFSNLSTGNGTQCEWDFGGVTATGCDEVFPVFTTSGVYDASLTVTTPNGCTDNFTITDYIDVRSNPIADFTANPLSTDILDGEITFENESQGATGYTWNFDDGSPETNVFSPTHQFPTLDPATYAVQLVATIYPGCSDTIRKAVEVIEDVVYFIPNTFTPDNDELNNTFQPVFVMGYDPADFNMKIFNRWGETIYETNDADLGWDGSYGGKIVPTGTYTWKIEFKTSITDERITINGHVTLLR